jgi:acetyl-CoA carboxylase biotin carboxyl carrier protein
MFTFEELCQLIGVVARSKVAAVEVEKDGVRVRIDGVPVAWTAPGVLGEPLITPQAVGVRVPPAASQPGAGGEGAVAGEARSDTEGDYLVTSPIVGTFYRAPSPDADPYVRTGQRVEKGQVLCIVEAMKLMNEIESEVRGRIVQILVQNEQPVEFGQKLFQVEPL